MKLGSKVIVTLLAMVAVLPSSSSVAAMDATSGGGTNTTGLVVDSDDHAPTVRFLRGGSSSTSHGVAEPRELEEDPDSVPCLGYDAHQVIYLEAHGDRNAGTEQKFRVWRKDKPEYYADVDGLSKNNIARDGPDKPYLTLKNPNTGRCLKPAPEGRKNGDFKSIRIQMFEEEGSKHWDDNFKITQLKLQKYKFDGGNVEITDSYTSGLFKEQDIPGPEDCGARHKLNSGINAYSCIRLHGQGKQFDGVSPIYNLAHSNPHNDQNHYQNYWLVTTAH